MIPWNKVATKDCYKYFAIYHKDNSAIHSVTLTNGVPIDTVSKMLGHKSVKTTQHYAKIVAKIVSEDMKALKSKYNKSI